ncbi:hypothetical protein [Streptomyces sp. NPDC054863]
MTEHVVDLNSLPDTRTARTNSLTREQVRRGNAFHEAAHALVGMAYGISLQRILLTETPLPDSDGGVVMSGLVTWNPCWVDEVEFAVQYAAGAIAEQRQFDAAGLDAEAAECHDRDAAVAVLTQSDYDFVLSGTAPAGGVTWEQITARAQQRVSSLWPEITLVAEALLAAPGMELSSIEVCALTGWTNAAPGTPPGS